MFSDFNSRNSRFGLFSRAVCLAVILVAAGAGLVPVYPGPALVPIRFEGNAFFSEKQLREAAAEELSDFEQFGHRKAEADDAAFQMELTYKKAGFYFAAVSYSLAGENGDGRLLFQFSEGPRVVVRDIVFSGNAFMAADRLNAFFRKERTGVLAGTDSYYVEEEIRGALAAIRDLYHSEGFIDIRIASPRPVFSEDRHSVSLLVDIDEGLRHIIRRVDFLGDTPDSAAAALRGIAESLAGKPFFNRHKQTLQLRVREIYGNLGYPDPEVKIEESRGEQEGDVILAAAIDSGAPVTVAAIIITGNSKTRPAFILNRLGFSPGDLFTLDRKRAAFKALYQTGLFDRIDIDLRQETETGRHLVAVNVKESKPRELFVETGWGSYELLRLGLGGRDRNFLGTGRIIRMEGKYSVKGETAVVGAFDPWFLGSEIAADLPVTYTRRQEPSFTRQEMGSALFFSKSFSPHVSATLGYSYQLSRILDVREALFAETLETRYSVAALKAQATIDTRNDFFYPSSGYRYSLALDFSDGYFGSDIGLVRLTAGGRHFFALPRNLVLGVRYNTGLMVPGRNQITIPLGERFYNGGENKVRSFRESRLGPVGLDRQPVGGMAFNIANVELRHRLTTNFSVSLFGDVGNLSPNRSRSEEGEAAFSDRSQLINTTLREYFRGFRSAVGIGCQYLLPVGPVRLDVAVNPDHKPERGEDQYVVHFSVGMAF